MNAAMQIVEMAISHHQALGKTWEEAAKQATAQYEGAVVGFHEALATLRQQRDEAIESRGKLTEVGTSRKEDIKAAGWYPGANTVNGVWSGLRQRMINGGLGNAIEQIDISTEEIVASLAQPHVDGDRRLGLVIGNVQSGKTANFSAVIAKALDSNYKFVIVLAGIHNNLRKQTQLRLERDLGIHEDIRDWYRLTDADGDFSDANRGNASNIIAQNRKIIAVVKKNGTRLRNLLRFIQSLDPETKRQTPFLIIDDESDQATPDSSASLDADPTAINKLLREIWAETNNASYVGYTATPFANVFMDPNTENGVYPELYPSDFIHIMPTPKNYFGASRLFGLGEDAVNANIPDVIRQIPKQELSLLAPRSGRPGVSSALAEALRWFIVAAAIRRTRGQKAKHSTMLIHTTHRIDPHFAMSEAVATFLEPLQRAAREGNLDEFREVFHQERDRAADLFTGEDGASTWQQVEAEIPAVLRKVKISVDNGTAEAGQRLAYPDEPQTVIVIGGGTLSRGLTLEGLFVSFFTRTSNAYDTLLQMGRWFGYRPLYEDLQRIWLSPGLEEDYAFLAMVESEVRADIARMTDAGKKPREIGVRVLLHPGRLQVTSPAKMKHVSKARASFEGSQLQTTRFDMSMPEDHQRNIDIALKLREKLASYRSAAAPDLYTDVPLEELQDFFTTFTVQETYAQSFKDHFEWSLKHLPHKTWNVIIPFDDVSNSFNKFRRTAIDLKDKDVTYIDVRGLMSSTDIIKDLLLTSNEAPEKPPAGFAKLREDRSGLNGRGLLHLYPIDRKSQLQQKQTKSGRIAMDVALRNFNSPLADNLEAPLLGLALATPFDTEGRLQDKGSYVAVEPIYGDPEFTEAPHPVDTERDFIGAQS